MRVVLAQAAGVQARREWMQRRDALQAQYDAAKAAKTATAATPAKKTKAAKPVKTVKKKGR